MTNSIITPLLPTTDARAYAMLTDALRAALIDALDTLNPRYSIDNDPRCGWNPFTAIRDADDYITAATRIASRITAAMTSDFLSPLAAFDSLLADDDFIDDCLTADFSADLLHCFDFSD
jgi:hypothetical protein